MSIVKNAAMLCDVATRLWRRASVIVFVISMLVFTGCMSAEREPVLRPLKAREILRLVSEADGLPLPEITGVAVGDVGQYEERPTPLSSPDDEVLCPGRRFVLRSHSRLVRAELLQGFGFTFVLQGEPQAKGETMGSRSVPLELVVEHPLLQDPVTGEALSSERQYITACIGQPADAVFQFTSDWERVSGPWTLRLFYKGRELAGKRFDVVGGRTAELPASDALPQKIKEDAPDLRVSFPSTASAPVVPAADRHTARSAPSRGPGGAKRIYVIVSSNIYAANAEQDVLALRALGYPAEMGVYRAPRTGRIWHTARLGTYGSVAEAEKAKSVFMRREGRPAYVVVRSESVGERHSGSVATPEPGFVVQVSANLEADNASNDAAGLTANGWPAQVLVRPGSGGKTWHTVIVGRYATRSEAESAAQRFRQKEGRQAFVVAVP